MQVQVRQDGQWVEVPGISELRMELAMRKAGAQAPPPLPAEVMLSLLDPRRLRGIPLVPPGAVC